MTKKTHELIGEGDKYQALLLESNKSIIKKLQMNGLIEACETAMSAIIKNSSISSISFFSDEQSTPDGQKVFRCNEGFETA